MSRRVRQTDLAEKLRANALALETMVGCGALSRPMLRALVADLRDFANEADSYEEARVLLSLMAK